MATFVSSENATASRSNIRRHDNTKAGMESLAFQCLCYLFGKTRMLLCI